jgi:DNA replication protein DnaC
MTALIHARVQERLAKLRLGHVALRLDTLLSEAARDDCSYLDFLDRLLTEETEAKQRKRVVMGVQIAHFPAVKTLEDFDFGFQPTVDAKLVRELATGRFVAHSENVLMFGPPGVGKSHLAVALGRQVVEAGHSTLFTSTTELLGALSRAEADGTLADKLTYFSKPKLLIIDELGYLPFERRSAHLLFQLVSRRYERGSILVTTNKAVTLWGGVFGDDMTAAAILDRLLHHSHTLTIQGESYRLKQKKKAGLLGKSLNNKDLEGGQF